MPETRRLDASGVRRLLVGDTVTLCGIDAEGRERRVLCVVAFRGTPRRKFLTWRDKGALRRCEIRESAVWYERG